MSEEKKISADSPTEYAYSSAQENMDNPKRNVSRLKEYTPGDLALKHQSTLSSCASIFSVFPPANFCTKPGP